MKKLSGKAQKRQELAALALRNALQLFDHHFTSVYGEERWPRLKSSLQVPVEHVALVNKHADQLFASTLLGGPEKRTKKFLPEVLQSVVVYSRCQVLEQHSDVNNEQSSSLGGAPQPLCSSSSSGEEVRWPHPAAESSMCPNTGLCCYYPLDAASLLPVELLDIQPYHQVLDVCSAPGGKALTILQKISLDHGSLTCNDVSNDRRQRLRNVMRQYLPKDDANKVDILAFDASQRHFIDCLGENRFDRVLVDAPCSSERHLLQDTTELIQWAPGRSRANADRQFSLLWNAVKVCRVDGLIVYSTCALSPLENDEVVAKLVKKLSSTKSSRSYQVEILPITSDRMPFGEPTSLGWHILPDVSNGFGPIYMALLKKVAVIRSSKEENDE